MIGRGYPIPKSQNAVQTFRLMPEKAAVRRWRYIAQEEEGAPGKGSIEVGGS